MICINIFTNFYFYLIILLCNRVRGEWCCTALSDRDCFTLSQQVNTSRRHPPGCSTHFGVNGGLPAGYCPRNYRTCLWISDSQTFPFENPCVRTLFDRTSTVFFIVCFSSRTLCIKIYFYESILRPPHTYKSRDTDRGLDQGRLSLQGYMRMETNLPRATTASVR